MNTHHFHLAEAYAEQVVYLNNKAIGIVVGNKFQKRVQGSRHFLRIPPSIASDEIVLETVQNMGANEVSVFDMETGTVYESSIANIKEHGIRFDRGYGKQIGLEFKYWHCILPRMNSNPELEAGL